MDTIEDKILKVVQENSFVGTWTDVARSDNAVDIWRRSQISRELERLLSSAETPTESSKRKRSNSDIQGKRPELSGIASLPADNLNTANPKLDKSIQLPTQPSQSSPGLAEIYGNRQPGKNLLSVLGPSCSEEIPDLPSESWHLLDVYFSYTHSWLPIVEKHDLLRTSYQYSQTRNLVASSGTSDHAVLWAAIAYAKFQHRAINNIPHAQGPVKEGLSFFSFACSGCLLSHYRWDLAPFQLSRDCVSRTSIQYSIPFTGQR